MDGSGILWLLINLFQIYQVLLWMQPVDGTACNKALVWGADGVGDKYVSASAWTDAKPPSHAKLDSGSYWHDDFLRNQGSFITADLRQIRTVTKVVVQPPKTVEAYVTEIYVAFSNDSLVWKTCRTTNGKHKIFQGNSNQFKDVEHLFDPRLTARFVRIYAKSWFRDVMMSFELYGCDIPELAFTKDLGCAVDMTATAGEHVKNHKLLVNGLSFGWWKETLYSWGMVVLDTNGPGCSVSKYHVFTPEESAFKAREMLAAIVALPDGTVFAGASRRGPGYPHIFLLTAEFRKLGIDIDRGKAQAAFTFVAKKGDPSFTKYVVVRDNENILKFHQYIKNFHKAPDYNWLGMADNSILASQLSSSRLHNVNGPPHRGRLFSNWLWAPESAYVRNAWTDAFIAGMFYQIDLSIVHEITGIITASSVKQEYYIMTFRVYYSSDLHSWDLQSTIYSANIEDIILPIHTVFASPVIGRAIRIAPLDYKGYPSMQLEITGKPIELGRLTYDPSKMKVTSDPAGGLCAFDTSHACNSGWQMNSAARWVEIDFGMLHYVTNVLINSTNGLSWSKLDFSYKKHPDQNAKDLQEEMVNTIMSNGNTRINFAHHISAWQLQIKFSSITGDGHVKAAVFAEKAPACPPGAFQNGEICVFPHMKFSQNLFFQDMCKEMEWTRKGHQFMVKDIHDLNHLYNFMNPYWTGHLLLTGFKEVGNRWTYDDGSVTGVNTPWNNGVARPVRSDECGYVMTQGETHANGDCTRKSACQTRPALAQEDTCLPTWSYYHEKGLPASAQYLLQTYHQVSVGHCLHLCIHMRRNECRAVTYFEETLNCYLFNTSSYGATLYSAKKVSTYEWACHEKNDVKVFRDLVGKVSYTLKASSVDSVKYNINEAPLKPWYSKFAFMADNGIDDGQQYYQVDFNKMLSLSGMLALGGRRTSAYYVESMYIWYWNNYGWQGLPDVNIAVDVNWERFRGKVINFPWRIHTEKMKLIGQTSFKQFTIKFEFYGKITDPEITIVDYPLGMKTKEVGGYQITASSFAKGSTVYPPSGVRLGSTTIGSVRGSWRPARSTTKEWVQVDLIAPHLITRVLVHKVGASGVLKYSVNASMDGKTWTTPLTDASGCVDRYFLYDEVLANLTTPVVARYVRILPTAFKSSIDLKIELFGSPVCETHIRNGGLAILGPSIPASFCTNDHAPSVVYKDTFNCTSWCIETSAQQTFIIDLRKVYIISRVFLDIKQQNSVTITTSIHFAVDTTFLQEQNAYWKKNGTNSTFILRRTKKARYIKITVQPAANVKFCLFADVHACKIQDCPVTYMQHKTSCFRVYDFNLRYSDAQSFCEEDGKSWAGNGHLVKLNDMSKVDTIYGLMDGKLTTAWVGATYSGAWKWSDGDAMSWAPWSPLANTALTAKSKGYYDAVQRGMVNDYSTASRSFICELKSKGDNPHLLWLYKNEATVNETDTTKVIGVDPAECLYNCQTGEQFGCGSLEYDADENSCTYATWSRYSSNKGIYNKPGKKSKYWELYNAGSCSATLFGILYNPTITASSSLGPNNGPDKVTYGALPVTFWQARASDTTPFLQLAFQQLMVASRILVAGNGDPNNPKYVTSFSVETSANNAAGEKQVDGFSQSQIFAGNYDAVTPYSVLLVAIPSFRYMKILPLTWKTGPAMRIQAFGCHFVDPLTCNNALRPVFAVPSSPDFHPPCHSGWTVIMRHQDPAFSFRHPWIRYKTGFGDTSYDFWVGNTLLAYLTKNRAFDLRIELWTHDNQFYSAEYHQARVENDIQKFKLSIASYEKGLLSDGGLVSSGLLFSTKDENNDGKRCSQSNGKGGFWFNSTSCSSGMLTGDLKKTTYWTTSRGSKVYAKKVLMKIIPTTASQDNIAATKSAARSSGNPLLPASLATDLIVKQDRASKSCTLGVAGTDPWWRVDLERFQAVKSLKIVTFVECCADNLQDFTVYVGSTSANGNFAGNGYKLCKNYAGTVPSGDVIIVDCISVINGRYIAIQMSGSNKVLSLCEVQAFAERAAVGIYQPCERNSQCTKSHTDCRPKNASTTEIYTCECRLYTRDINAVCYPEAEMQPLIQDINLPKDGVVRNFPTRGSLPIRISHNGGATITSVSSGSIFDIDVFLTSEKPDIATGIFKKLPESSCSLIEKPTFVKDVVYEQSFNITLNVTLHIDISLCFNLSHICVNLTKASTGFYFETNTSNDIHCIEIKKYANCQPGMDTSISSVSLPGTTRLVRGVKTGFPFSFKIALGATAYDIVSPASGFRNYEVSYFYDDKDITTYQEFVSSGPSNETSIDITEAAMSLNKNSDITVTVNVTAGPADEKCEQLKYVCFLLRNTDRATYNDTNMENNVKCFDMSIKKECFPAVTLKVTGFTKKSGPLIVRGYNASIEVDITVSNEDPLHNIIPVGNPRKNFAFELSFLNSLSKRRKRATTSSIGPLTVVVFGNTSSGLGVNATKTYTGTVHFNIPRDKCSDLHFICGGVSPSSGASFNITGSNPISCTNFDPLKNCIGVAVKDPKLLSNSSIIPINATIRSHVQWSEGTDVVYKLEFGDGQSYGWNWQSAGHIHNYSSASVTITHTYVIYGNFTLRLNISNSVGSTILTLKVLVEPILDVYITFKDVWMPKPVPSIVNIEAGLSSTSLYKEPFNMWCNADFDDSGMTNSVRSNVTKTISLTSAILAHTYTFDKPDANLTINCSNHVSKVGFKKRVILRAPITNLTITNSTKLVKTGSSMTFQFRVATGSHVVFDINFGDGTTTSATHPSIYSNLTVMNVTHIYNTAGNYTVNATAKNIYYSDNYTLPNIIIVQNEVKDIQLVVPGTLTWSASPLAVIVRSTGAGPPYPTHPSCHWKMNSTTLSHSYQTELTAGTDASKTVNIARSNIGYNVSFTIQCYNLVSSVTLQKNTTVYENITDFRVKGAPAVVPNSPFSLVFSMKNGSNINFKVQDGKGNTFDIKHPSVLASTHSLVFNVTYTTLGNYTVTVTASNPIASDTQTHNVVVQYPVTHITYRANDSVLYTPGEVTYTVTVGSSQGPLRNLHCNWNYNNRSADYFYYDNLNAGDSFLRTKTFDRSYLGLLNTSINCSNLLSSSAKRVQTEIILDAVILGSFETNGSVFLTNITYFTANISRFGIAPRSCFRLDLGDGIQKVMFGLSVCAPDATALGIPFQQISYGTEILEYDYEYQSVNNFVSTLFAYNHVSNHTMTTIAVVRAWTCFAPNITDLDNFTDVSQPMVRMKSKQFEIMPELELDCMRTDVVVNVWEVTTTTAMNTVVHKQTDGQGFNYTTRLLNYGLWRLVYTASMQNNPGTNKSETVYLKIIKSPLDPGIGGGYTETLEFTKPFTINALNYSFDPDFEPSNKTGLGFKWNCTQFNSTFQAASVNVATLDAKMQEVFKYRQMCFGQQSADLMVTSGVFDPDTSLMLPRTWYHIGLTLSKDSRTGTTDKWLYVKDLSAPVIQILCIENCANRKAFLKKIVFEVRCTANCKSRLGGLNYEWSLEVNYDNGSVEAIKNLQQWTESGIMNNNITFKKETLRAGENHTMTVMAFTPGSQSSQLSLKFLVNRPPFAGTCKVNPLDGIASVTNFIATCVGWKEFKPITGTAKLRYDFGIGYPGSIRVFPVGFGSSPQTEEVKFPVGATDKNFQLNVITKIVDQVDDFYQFIFSVKVNPRPETIASVLQKVSEQVGRELRNFSQSGHYRKAAALAFSLCSELNVPDRYYLPDPDPNSTTSSEELRKEKARLRTEIIKDIASYPIQEPEELLQNTEVMRSAMAVKDQLEIDALEIGTNRLENLTDSFRTFKAGGKVKNVKLMTNDMVGLSVKCMSAADFLYKEDKKPEIPGNGTADNDTIANITAQAEEDQRILKAKVQRVMRSVVSVVRNMSGSTAEDMKPGDKDEEMVFDEATLIVSMVPTSQFGNETVKSSKQGSISFKNPKELFGADVPKCLETQLFFTAINPFIYGNGNVTNKVNSSVLDIQMNRCDHKLPTTTIRKKRAAPAKLTPKIPYDISLITTNLPDPVEVVNKSQYDRFIFHQLDVSYPVKPVQIYLKHNLSNTLELYIGINDKPDHQKNFRNFTVEAVNSTLLSVKELSNFVNDSVNGTVYVAIRSSACSTAPQCSDEEGTLTYTLYLYDIKCQKWDEKREQWDPMACKVEKDSTPKTVHFKSNLFGSLGTGLLQAPNKIDFGTVFDNLAAKIVDNMPVVATVIGLIILYIIGLVVSRNLDKADAIRWVALPLIGNLAGGGHEYEVHVYTGFKRKAETTSKVSINLFGAHGETGTRDLADTENRKNFQNGECSSFLLTSSTDLGKLHMLNVWHDGSGGDWYLSKIIVVDCFRNQWYQFMCNKWFAEDKDDGQTKRTLDVAIIESHINTGVLMRHNMSRKLFDDHLWLSVVYRKSRSRFSRAQRLSCCVALLYLTMIGNAMWYKAPDEESGPTRALHLGPIAISVSMLAASIYSSIVVIPPIMLITFLFAKSRDKPRVDDTQTNLSELYYNYYYSKKTRKEEPKPKQEKKKPLSLPYWCISIGWILVFLSIAASALFTILYSFQWGGVKSTGWLIAFLLSFFESVLIVQPAKVMLITMILSVMLKKDVDVEEYTDNYGEMQNWYDIYNDREICKLRGKRVKDVGDEDTLKLKRLDNKVAVMIKEIVSNFFIVFVMLCVAYVSYDPNMYLQNANLKSAFVDDVSPKVEHFLNVWPWVEEILLPALYYTEDYSGNVVSEYEKKFISDGLALRFGPPRLRQLRVSSENCDISRKDMQRFSKRCIPWHVSKHADHRDYITNWTVPINVSNNGPTSTPTRVRDAFRYRSGAAIKVLPYWATFEVLPGGGYVANLGNDKSGAVDLVKQLKAMRWIDERTRALFAEFNIFNANTELFTQVILAFEFPPMGSVYEFHTFSTIQLYRYNGVLGLFSLIMEVLSLLVFIVLVALCVKNIIVNRAEYLKEFWNWNRMMALVLYAAAVVVYVVKTKRTIMTTEYMMNNREETVSFQHVTLGDQVFLNLFGLVIFLLTLGFLHILRYNRTIVIFGQVLAASAKDLLSMALIIMIVVAAFASIGHSLFGYQFASYKDLPSTVTTLCTNFLGKFDFNDISQNIGPVGEVFMLFYLLIMIFIVINLFITLLCTFLDAVRADESVIPKDHEIVDHFLAMVEGFMLPDKISAKEDKEKSDS